MYCIPGNHDDPARLRSALARPPFQVGGHVDLGAWRIVLVDSCVPRQARGRISSAELAALDAALARRDRYAIVCVHHHPVSMASRWLDAVGIENADEFFRVLDAHAQRARHQLGTRAPVLRCPPARRAPAGHALDLRPVPAAVG